MKMSLKFLVLFVAATCTSAYILKIGGRQHSDDDDEDGLTNRCWEVVEKCGPEETDKPSHNEVSQCKNELNGIMEQASKTSDDSESNEAFDDCMILLHTCMEHTKSNSPFAHSVYKIIISEAYTKCKAAEASLREGSGDGDDEDSWERSVIENDLERLLKKINRNA